MYFSCKNIRLDYKENTPINLLYSVLLLAHWATVLSLSFILLIYCELRVPSVELH